MVSSEMAVLLQDGNSPREVLFQMQTPHFSKYLLFAAICKELQKIFKQSGLCESGFSARKQPFFGTELQMTNLSGPLNTRGIPAAVYTLSYLVATCRKPGFVP